MVKRKINEFKLTTSHYKILQTVKDLNDVHKYPTPKGINNILSGKLDDETKEYASYITFGTLISFPGRRLCSFVLNLSRKGYLANIYDPKTDGMYIYITEKGEESLFLFNKKHKDVYKKKSPQRHKEIVEI